MSTGVPGNRRVLALMTAIAMLASLVGFYGGLPAQAASVEPSLIEETANQTCIDLLGTEQDWSELKVDNDGPYSPLGDGTFDDGQISVTISNFDGKSFDWTATDGVDAVFVKAGAAGSYLYEYDPESTGDTALTTPGEGQTNEISHITFCYDVDDQQPPLVPSVTPDIGCQVDWTGSSFEMHGVVDFAITPDEGIESIAITPKAGGNETITGATWTGDPVALLPWAYEWIATVEEGYVGETPSGEFELNRDWFADCACPAGTIDLSDTGVLYGSSVINDSKLGEPASPVTIPGGFYDIYLASFDDHSHKPDQTQPQETWALADAKDGVGSFESPPTQDLPNDLNFMSYHVTASTGSVFVPEFANADLWTVHGAAPTDNINSIEPACAQFIEDEREVEVGVTANSCLVDDQGQPVGSIDVTVDPGSRATVEIYADEAKTNLVATVTGPDTIEELAPGTYYWEATPDDGYDLAGPAEGEVTIEDCDAGVSVTTDSVCSLGEGNNPYGTVGIGIDPDSSATVSVHSDAGMTNEVLSTTTGGSFDLDPGTYYWEAAAADGFALEGTTSGSFTIDLCEVSVAVNGVCEVVEQTGVGLISVDISVVGGATVDVLDSGEEVLDTFTEDGTLSVPEGQTYSWQATPEDGFSITGSDSGTLDIETCTPEPEDGQIVVEKVVASGDTSLEFDFTVAEAGWQFELTDGESDIMTVEPGSYAIEETLPDDLWSTSVSCDGVEEANPATVTVEAGETVTCTFTNIGPEVEALILVTVSGACLLDDGEAIGRINVEISVDGGATVVITDSEGGVVDTLTESGLVTVDADATYNWEATPSEGFEFPVDFDNTGQVTIEDCSEPEVLPFTGFNTDVLLAVALLLLGSGLILVTSVGRRQRRHGK